MLSYRHAFHAGNFADVIKHVVLVEIVTHLSLKDASFCYIDTHSGAGFYNLDSAQAQKNREFLNGIGQLKLADWPELQTYLQIIARFNPDGRLRAYPGSPKIAEAILRPQDQAWLFELHPNDFTSLRQNFTGNPKFNVRRGDGYQELIGLLPPKSKRGLVLIDPSYEIKQDYESVVDTLIKAYRRFSTGIYALWYPVVERCRIDNLEKSLITSGIKRIQLFELGQSPDAPERGMTAAGMIVINPPWTLFGRMRDILPKLAAAMAAPEQTHFRCEELVGE